MNIRGEGDRATDDDAGQGPAAGLHGVPAETMRAVIVETLPVSAHVVVHQIRILDIVLVQYRCGGIRPIADSQIKVPDQILGIFKHVYINRQSDIVGEKDDITAER